VGGGLLGCQPRRATGRAHTPVQGLCSVRRGLGAAHRVGDLGRGSVHHGWGGGLTK
jgi:hypothetical protein